MESNRESIMFDPNDIVNESFHSRFSTVKFKEQPIQLIVFRDDNKLIINQEALAFLKSIEDEVIVVSSIGKAKTGKSFLLNQLIDSNNGVNIVIKIVPS